MIFYTGCAKHISFRPLRATDVQIPQGLAIIVGHSLAELNKAANDQFNCRVAECRLAATVRLSEIFLYGFYDSNLNLIILTNYRFLLKKKTFQTGER